MHGNSVQMNRLVESYEVGIRNEDDSRELTEACYVYSPNNGTREYDERPKKRRKRSHLEQNPKPSGTSIFIPLLGGAEKLVYAELRESTYNTAWVDQEIIFENVLQQSNAETVANVCEFLSSVPSKGNVIQIPTGFITTGLATMSSAATFVSISNWAISNKEILLVKIAASECGNLKSVLKHINLSATNQGSFDDEDELLPTIHGNTRLLNYDLQILYDHVLKYSISQVTLYFQTSEALDGSILAQLVDVLSSWQDKIPFILLFEIASSTELFQEKLSRTTVRRLQGVMFETKNATETLEVLVKCMTSARPGRLLWMGPSLLKMLLGRQLEHIQSAQALVQTMKYIHMTHFFANALSVLLSDNFRSEPLQEEHYEAVRNMPSFRRHVDDSLDKGELSKVERLLDDDTYLHQNIIEALDHGQQKIKYLLTALEVIRQVESASPSKTDIIWSKLYIQGMSGQLQSSGIVTDVLDSIRKMPSDMMADLLESLSQEGLINLGEVKSDLEKLTSTLGDTQGPLRSEHDVYHQTLRTTVIAQRVELSKHKLALSKEDTEYSKIVAQVETTLRKFFDDHSINPKDLFLHEIFLFDLKTPCREVFAPLTRTVVERALSAPHDYLACDCCSSTGNTLSSTQPPTAILYQLYLESGAMINISDLWLAFSTILGPEPTVAQGDDEDIENPILAMFYRSLAELRYLGMIKNSRKKADHLMKLSWKGL